MSTTFKEFLDQQLLEGVAKGWDVEKKSVEEAIALLNKLGKNGLQSIANGSVLWRGWSKGVEGKQKFAVIDTTNSLRTSRDYDNAYMLLMNASKHFKDIPSRSNSLICSTNYHDANAYSGSNAPTAVIPLDGTKVAFIPHVDDFNNVELHSKSAEKLNINGTFTGVTMNPFFKAIAVPSEVKNKYGSKEKEFTNHAVLDAAMKKFSPIELTLIYLMTSDTEPDAIEVVAKNYSKWGDVVDMFFEISHKALIGGEWKLKNDKKVFDTILDGVNKGMLKFSNEAKHFYNLMKGAEEHARFSHLATSTVKPSDIGLKVVDAGGKIPQSTECWIAGKAVIISKQMMAKIMAQLIMNKYPVSEKYKFIYADELKALQNAAK